ncbi:MAG: DUF1786 domain-containing protein [Thermoleophilia bacterium]
MNTLAAQTRFESGLSKQPASPGSLPTGRLLAIDVGAGTADILLVHPHQSLENAVKLVVPARTQIVARQIAAAGVRGATVVFHGPLMGGGAVTAAMKAHVGAGHQFVASETAALTFADNLERVRAGGVRVVGDGTVQELLHRLPPQSLVEIHSGDLDPAGLRAALAELGVEPLFDAIAVAVQDHGYSPHGSNRVFRFALWERAVREQWRIGDLFYPAASVPPELTRLRSTATLAAELGHDVPILAADTGPAALYGALPDGVDDAVLINVGNGHTIIVVASAGRLAGVFEHHTGLLDGPGLESRLRHFLAGELIDERVRDEGGHGCVLAAPVPGDLPLIVTGPRRGLLADSTLPLQFAAPHGDMMLTGCFGLLRAYEERRPT